MAPRYKGKYSIEVRTGSPGGGSMWVWAQNCPNMKTLRYVFRRLKNSMIEEGDYRAVRNEANVVT